MVRGRGIWLFLFSIISILSREIAGQERWETTGCGSSTPSINRISVNDCTSYEPNEYITFYIEGGEFALNSDDLRVEVLESGYYSGRWSANPAMTRYLNRRVHCDYEVFIDPFSEPYNGVIPSNSNVLAFVRNDQSTFGGNVSSLCADGPYFVIYGNYSRTIPRSMFANQCPDSDPCFRSIKIELGACQYDIVYNPNNLSPSDGAYLEEGYGGPNYGSGGNCRPEFYSFPSPEPPDIQFKTLEKCENDQFTSTFRTENGSSFTSWYIDLDDAPVHWGPDFSPPSSLFPSIDDGQNYSTREIYVVNTVGGRRSEPIELRLQTLRVPIPENIGIKCGEVNGRCQFCENNQLKVEINISEPISTPYDVGLSSSGEKFYFSDIENGDSISVPGEQLGSELVINSVENELGCRVYSKDGFNTFQLDRITAPEQILPDFPDLCKGDSTFRLPALPDELMGHWELYGDTILEIDPGVLDAGVHEAEFVLDSGMCVNDTIIHFSIFSNPVTTFTLPDFDCSSDTFQPILSDRIPSGGVWTINSDVVIDPDNGRMNTSEFVGRQKHTVTYGIEDENGCNNHTSISFESRDCSCRILSGEVRNIICDNGGTLDDSSDDTYRLEYRVEGENMGVGWESSSGAWSGTYGEWEELGSFVIDSGIVVLEVMDSEHPECVIMDTIRPPESCSPGCDMRSEVRNIICDDGGTLDDSSDDTYRLEYRVEGENMGMGWESSSGAWSGTYGKWEELGSFVIDSGIVVLEVMDSDHPECVIMDTIRPPESCSPGCDMRSEVRNIICDDGGTLDDSSDDTYRLEYRVEGENMGVDWESSSGAWSGRYGEWEELGPFVIDSGIVVLEVMDSEHPECVIMDTIRPPESCSPGCDMRSEARNITCDAGGTLDDSSDDTYRLEYRVEGENMGMGWESSSGAWSGTYGKWEELGPFVIDSGIVVLEVMDSEHPECVIMDTIRPPESCSPGCDMRSEERNIICDDGGTLDDSSDDTYRLEYQVEGENMGVGWESSSGTWSGTYREWEELGPFMIDSGIVVLAVMDSEHPECVIMDTIRPPESCSEISCDWDVSRFEIEECIENSYLNVGIESTGKYKEISLYAAGEEVIHNISGVREVQIPFSLKDSTFSFQTINGEYCEKKRRLTGDCLNLSINIPNAFSPNGDGINDELEVFTNIGVNEIYGSVFDKWGNQVHEFGKDQLMKMDKIPVWNGYIDGYPGPTGVYIVKLFFRDSGGKTESKIAPIHLIK